MKQSPHSLKSHYYSPKTYQVCGKIMKLPAECMLHRWMSGTDCQLGLLSKCLQNLGPKWPHATHAQTFYASVRATSQMAANMTNCLTKFITLRTVTGTTVTLSQFKNHPQCGMHSFIPRLLYFAAPANYSCLNQEQLNVTCSTVKSLKTSNNR